MKKVLCPNKNCSISYSPYKKKEGIRNNKKVEWYYYFCPEHNCPWRAQFDQEFSWDWGERE